MAALKYDNPANRRPPSDRDVQIYFAHKCDCKLQKDLAFHHGMDPSRVSQICKRVRRHLADVSSQDGELDHGQQQRLERRVERERLERLYGHSLRMLEEFEKPSSSAREDKQGNVVGKTIREERSARVQALKSATRLAESLGKIAEREPAPQPTLHGANGYVPLDLLTKELMRQRQVAERTRGVPAVDDAYDVVWFLMRALQGYPAKPVEPGSKLAASLGQIVAVLAAAGVGGATPHGGSPGRGRESIATTVSHQPELEPQLTPDPRSGAHVPHGNGSSLLDGCPPEVAATLIASGFYEKVCGGAVPAATPSYAATLARENMANMSAAEGREAGGESGIGGRESVGQEQRSTEYSVLSTQYSAGTAAPPEAAPPPPPDSRPPKPDPRAEIVGSPEWQVARKKWLQERDERVEAERVRKIREKCERDEEIRQHRAAAAARNRWLDAGRVEY